MPDANPIPGVTPLTGSTTVDANVVFEPERLTYIVAGEIAARIVAKIAGHKDVDAEQPVVVAGMSFLADLGNLAATGVLLDALLQDYETLAQRAEQRNRDRGRGAREAQPPAALSSLSIVPAASVLGAGTSLVAGLTGVLGVASLFREDVSFTGVKAAVDSLSFTIAIARELKARGFKQVLIPELYVILNQNSGSGSLPARLRAVEEARLKVWQQVTPMISKLVALDAELEQKAASKNQAEVDRLTQEVNELRSDLNPISDPLAKMDQRLTDLLADLQKTDPASGLSGLARLLRAEAIGAVNPNYLLAKIVASGGHNRVSRSLLRTLFIGDGLSFMGGCVARWALLDSHGAFGHGGISSGRKAGKFPPLPFWWQV